MYRTNLHALSLSRVLCASGAGSLALLVLVAFIL